MTECIKSNKRMRNEHKEKNFTLPILRKFRSKWEDIRDFRLLIFQQRELDSRIFRFPFNYFSNFYSVLLDHRMRCSNTFPHSFSRIRVVCLHSCKWSFFVWFFSHETIEYTLFTLNELKLWDHFSYKGIQRYTYF